MTSARQIPDRRTPRYGAMLKSIMSHPATFEFDARVSSAVSAPWGQIHRYWQAANYLTVGQIYLKDNPLLREPLLPEHIKPRLLGHWGTSPGLSFIYAHVNR